MSAAICYTLWLASTRRSLCSWRFCGPSCVCLDVMPRQRKMPSVVVVETGTTPGVQNMSLASTFRQLTKETVNRSDINRYSWSNLADVKQSTHRRSHGHKLKDD